MSVKRMSRTWTVNAHDWDHTTERETTEKTQYHTCSKMSPCHLYELVGDKHHHPRLIFSSFLPREKRCPESCSLSPDLASLEALDFSDWLLFRHETVSWDCLEGLYLMALSQHFHWHQPREDHMTWTLSVDSSYLTELKELVSGKRTVDPHTRNLQLRGL